MEAGSAIVKIKADMSDFNTNMQTVGTKLAGLGTKFAAFAKVGGVVAAGVGAAGGAMLGMANNAAAATDRVDKLSQKLGLSRQGFQELDFITSQSGTSIEAMSTGMKTLATRMQESAEGTGVGAEAFTKLGVSVFDANGKMLNQEQILTNAITAFQGMESGATKAALASDLFGRSGQELLPLLNSSAGSMEQMRQKANELGLVMSDTAINSGVQFTDTMDQLKRSFGTAAAEVGVALMPAISAFANWIIENMPTIQSVIQVVFDAIGTVVSTFTTVINAAATTVSGFVSSSSLDFETIKTTVETLFGAVSTFLSTTWETIKTFWSANGESITTNASTVWQGISGLIGTAMTAIRTAIETAINAIKPFIETSLTTIFGIWDRHGQTIMTLISTAFETIQTTIETVMPILTAIIETAWTTIGIIIDTATTLIASIIDVVFGIITGDFEAIQTGLTTIWQALWDGITGIIEGVLTLALGWGKSLWDNFLDGMKEKWKAVSKWFSEKIKWIKEKLSVWKNSQKEMDGGGNGQKTINGLASGTNFWSGGPVMVGEEGPELVDLPRGSRVFDKNRTQDLLSGKGSSGITQNITINAPNAMSPYQVGREVNKSSRRLAMEW